MCIRDCSYIRMIFIAASEQKEKLNLLEMIYNEMQTISKPVVLFDPEQNLPIRATRNFHIQMAMLDAMQFSSLRLVHGDLPETLPALQQSKQSLYLQHSRPHSS